MTLRLQPLWCGRVVPEKPSPASLPHAPLPKQPGVGGDSRVWGGAAGARGGQAAANCPGRSAKSKAVYKPGLFLERTLTFAAQPPAFKLQKGRTARVCRCSRLGCGARRGRTSPPDFRQDSRAQPGTRGHPGAGAQRQTRGPRAGRAVPRRRLPWARPARPVRVSRWPLGAK